MGSYECWYADLDGSAGGIKLEILSKNSDIRRWVSGQSTKHSLESPVDVTQEPEQQFLADSQRLQYIARRMRTWQIV